MVLSAALLLGILGCSDDPVRQPEPQTETREVWMGRFNGQGVFGYMILDLRAVGAEVTAQLTFRRHGDLDARFATLAGTMNDDVISLGFDYPVGNHDTFTGQRSSSLTGTFAFTPAGLDVEFECDELEVLPTEVVDRFDVDHPVMALAHDGENLWLSTTSNFQRISPEGERLAVRVFYLVGYWTTDAFATDGTRLWGHLPGTLIEGNVSRQVSHLIEFDETGTVNSAVLVEHRTAGLAWDGENLWSLEDRSRLHRLSASGGTLETMDLELVEAHALDYHLGRFWTLGWFARLLFELGPDGRVIRAYDLPTAAGPYPTGIAFAGDEVWYSHSHIFAGSEVFRLRLGTPSE
jgi:hypothetical protein